MEQPSRRFSRAGKQSEIPSFLLPGFPRSHKLNSHNIYAGNLTQAHAGSVVAASVSVDLSVITFTIRLVRDMGSRNAS